MIAHGTGKKIPFWDGIQFVERNEVVHFVTEAQRDAALAADDTISKTSILPPPIGFRAQDPVNLQDNAAFQAAVTAAVREALALIPKG